MLGVYVNRWIKRLKLSPSGRWGRSGLVAPSSGLRRVPRLAVGLPYDVAVPTVFVSHASADQPYVGKFVDILLKLGCELHIGSGELFYSSGADTGVASGAELLHRVRSEVAEAELVIALITPTFLTRPVSMAELGAAWGALGSEKLFPILAPGMQRRDLEGIFPSLLIRSSDDDVALDELHDRVGSAVGRVSRSLTWGQHKRAWLEQVSALVATLPMPPARSIEDFSRLNKRLESAQAEIKDLHSRCKEVEEQARNLAKLKDPVAAARVMLPRAPSEKYDLLVRGAQDALRKLPSEVAEALWYSLHEYGMPYPDSFEDRAKYQMVLGLRRQGWLIDGLREGTVVPNDEFKEVQNALDAIRELELFLESDESAEVADAFLGEKGMPLRLNTKRAWDELLKV